MTSNKETARKIQEGTTQNHGDTGESPSIFGCSDIRLSADETAFFRDAQPLGFILFARNVADPEQLRRLTGELRDALGRDAPIFIDQEGGRVQRLRAPYWRDWSPPLDLITQARDPARALWIQARLIAHELRALGIDANCAPCADIATEFTHVFLRNRCYGTQAAQVTQIARSVAQAYLAGGVLPVLKHIPGHGRARQDSHKTLPHVDASYASLSATDFAPFRALADLPIAMTAHVVYSALDAQDPATQSARVIQMIREDIGFSGLLVSDDLNMQALHGGLGARTERALAAGCDIALHCSGIMGEMREVAAACPVQSAQTRARAAAALAQRGAAQALDVDALEAEYAALIGA